jgi:4-amino-4-deoxy-L-arabinose transferase-like glycosyltransferase
MKGSSSTVLEGVSEIKRERLYLAGICGVALMRFLNLGFLDLQAWDEALYAVRSESILRFGGWLDQTRYAIDGLYSSLHPPLYVWLTTVSFGAFGVSEFAARFFSALFGALTLFVIYRIGKHIGDARLGFFAALLYGLNPFVTFYTRQGQFDATLVFFLSLSILMLLRAEKEGSFKLALLAGIAVGAALMTKLYVGLGIPLVYGFWILLGPSERKERSWKMLGLSLVTAIVVALPWHLYMTIMHGKGDPLFFLRASALFERSLYGIEGNVKPLEVLYFFNQLFVLFPAGVAWFGHGLFTAVREKKPGWYMMALWFAVFFLVFSLMRTKLAVYLLPMLVPASLIAAREISKVVRGTYSRGGVSIFLAATGLSVLWALSQAWRNATKSVITAALRLHLPPLSDATGFLVLLLLASCILVLSYLAVKRSWVDQVRGAIPYLLFVPSFIVCFYQITRYDRFQYKDGAAELAEFIAKKQPSEIVVAGYERNPQLTYYLEGADIGWREDLPVKRIVPPKDRSQFRSWLTEQLSGAPDDIIVVIEKDKFIRYEWVTSAELVPPDYDVVFESRRYAAFERAQLVHYAQILLNPRIDEESAHKTNWISSIFCLP